MMEPADIQDRLMDFLRREVFSDRTDLTADTDLIASGFDSLSLVALLLFIEKTFQVWVPEGEINETTLQNARTLTALIVRLLDERQPAS